MNNTIEHLLQQADQAASQENWGEVCRLLENVLVEEPQHPAALTSLGISKLHQDQPASAAEHFQEVVDLNPFSPQAYNNLGVAYALQSIWGEAEHAYQQAIDLDPENVRAWKNLAEVYLQQNHRLMEGVQILAAVLKKDPRDTEALSMLAGCYEEVGDGESAALLYRQMLEVEEDHPHAAARLEDLEPEPEPSQQIARPEHAQKLAALKNLSGGNGRTSPSSPKQRVRSAAFLGPSTFSFQRRMEGPARALAADGIEIKFSSHLEPADLDRFNAFIINKPHQTEELYRIVQQLIQTGKQVVADLDLDFFSLPENHPEYNTAGPGNAEAMARLEQVLDQIDHFTVPNQSLADRLADQVSQAAVIPTGWAREGSTWEAPRPKRDTVNFGLLSTHTQPEIDPEIKDQISEAVLAAPDALLTAAGDYQILAEFDQLPDDKKMFIPLGAYQDYPYALAHVDVLLVPEKSGPFTDTKSDTALLEAGIRRIPWLATRIPSYWDWGVGGIFVSGKSWSSTIQRLAENPAERKALGRAGFEKAKQRESRLVVSWWKDLLMEIQV